MKIVLYLYALKGLHIDMYLKIFPNNPILFNNNSSVYSNKKYYF
jgi:hypothetical protein